MVFTGNNKNLKKKAKYPHSYCPGMTFGLVSVNKCVKFVLPQFTRALAAFWRYPFLYYPNKNNLVPILVYAKEALP